jgi:dihydrofolate reductase
MPALISELIVSLDMCARGTRSPGYYGYLGPEFDAWLKANNEKPHRKLMGRKTYEMLNALPAEARGEGWRKMTQQPGYLFSRTLEHCEWPGLELVRDDLLGFVRKLKQDGGSELRVLGSLSIMRQLVEANLLDVLRLMVCPLVVPQSGVERIFKELPDMAWSRTGSLMSACCCSTIYQRVPHRPGNTHRLVDKRERMKTCAR